jgi:hypothetical protein
MRFFNHKPTVGSRLVEASEQIVSEEQRLQSLLESHKVMAQDKLGQIFSPLTGSQIRGLAPLTNNIKSWH